MKKNSNNNGVKLCIIKEHTHSYNETGSKQVSYET